MTRGPLPAPGTGGGPRPRHEGALPSCKCTVLLCSLGNPSALGLPCTRHWVQPYAFGSTWLCCAQSKSLRGGACPALLLDSEDAKA